MFYKMLFLLAFGFLGMASGILIQPYANLSGADLSNVDLINANLTGADLSNADLSNADLSNADLTYADLSGAEFTGVTGVLKSCPDSVPCVDGILFVPGANYTSTSYQDLLIGGEEGSCPFSINYDNLINLEGVNVSGMNFQGKLCGINFRGADLTDVQFSWISGSDLSNADMSRATIGSIGIGGEFQYLNLTSTILRNVVLHADRISHLSMNNADASSLIIDLPDGRLAYVAGSNFTGTNFTNASITDTYFHHADFTGADLTGADLEGVVKLVGDDLSGVRGQLLACPASIDSVFICVNNYLIGPSANLSNADLSGADLTNVDLTDVDLTGADLRGANLTGVRGKLLACPASTDTGVICANKYLVGLGADLSGADLRGADLTSADLSILDMNSAIIDGSKLVVELNIDNIVLLYRYLNACV